MRTIRIDGWIEAQSPLVHFGDEKTGSTPILRTIPIWDPAQNRRVPVPIVSGNAIRGVLRRLVMRDMLDRLSYNLQSTKLHHALFTGGLLESTDETSGEVDLAFRREVRDGIPALALFGTALGNQMIPSCLKVSHAYPYCREVRAILPPGLEDARLEYPARHFTFASFHTRRDELRAEREEDEQAMQMLVEYEAFVPGTRFAHGFVLVNPSDLEVSCLAHVLALWREVPFIGGKSGSGEGRIAFGYDCPFAPQPYTDYLSEQRDALVALLDKIAERLGK